MEDQEAADFSSEHESHVFKKKSGAPYAFRQQSTKQKGSALIIIAFAVLIIVLFVIGVRLYDMQKTINALQGPKVKNHSETNTNAQASIPVSAAQVKRITELQLKVQRLSQLINKLQNGITGGVGGKLNLANLTSSQLSEQIQHQFQNHKVMINFILMHNREVFYYQKVEFLKSCLGSDLLRGNQRAKIAFMQAIANFKNPHFNVHMNNEVKDWQNKDKERISRDYDLNLQELPFCIVVPTLNNANKFRYQYNLQSIVNLDYSNYKVVIVDDASTDHTSELIKQWVDEYEVVQSIVVVTNNQRRTAVPNIHVAITQHCGPNDIVVLVDGDDELLGRYSLKVFNHIYQKNKVDIVYSNHLQFYTHMKQVYRGWSFQYTDEEKKNNRYRDVPQKISHLRSFKASLYRQIKEEDLKDQKGQWLTSTYDQVICLPMFQMSCGRSRYVEEFFYLYNFGIGTNDLQVDPGLQKNVADYVKFKKPKYQCVPQS